MMLAKEVKHLNFTPPNSTLFFADFLKKALDDYIEELPVPVKLLRSPTRLGLIQARLLGAKEAQGEVLTFLDAHCECTEGWLEALLSRIAEDPKTVACPVIDIINDETFAYVKSFELHWGKLLCIQKPNNLHCCIFQEPSIGTCSFDGTLSALKPSISELKTILVPLLHQQWQEDCLPWIRTISLN